MVERICECLEMAQKKLQDGGFGLEDSPRRKATAHGASEGSVNLGEDEMVVDKADEYKVAVIAELVIHIFDEWFLEWKLEVCNEILAVEQKGQNL